MTPRVLLERPLSPGDTVALDADRSHHLVRVLRLATGARIELFDGRGHRFDAVITQADRDACRVAVQSAIGSGTESPLEVTLAQCLSGAERMDYTIEKAVELGVARIVPLASRRSKIRLQADRVDRRLEHWRRIVIAACMQCGRDLLPAIDAPRNLEDWLATGADTPGTRVVLALEASRRLSEIPLSASSPVTLLVGPEAGFDADEIRVALAAGFQSALLGPRVLRTETAGLAALAVLQARAGDL